VELVCDQTELALAVALGGVAAVAIAPAQYLELVVQVADGVSLYLVSVSGHPEAVAVRIRLRGRGHGPPRPFNLKMPGYRQRRLSLWGSVRREPTCPSRAGVDTGVNLRLSGAEGFPHGGR